jgi:hypothetical protein
MGQCAIERNSECQIRRLFVALQKKTLINNLKTNKKAITASTPAEAKVSAKVTPRAYARLHARLTSPVDLRVRAKL